MHSVLGKYKFFGFILILAAAVAGTAFLRFQPVHSRSSGLPERSVSSSAGKKIASAVLSEASADAPTPVIVLLDEQADTSRARQIDDWNERGRYVYKTLSEHADRTQAGLRTFFESRGIPYRSFWAANMIAAELDVYTMMQLAERADVARIDSNLPTKWIEEPEVEKALLLPDQLSAPDAIEWGVNNVNAPAVWALGAIGQGIVIGDLDTGVRWTHNSIKRQYRGWNGTAADHNYNWWDAIHQLVRPDTRPSNPCGLNSAVPCDDNRHGTHTVGTIVGDDGAGNQVGVAPGAKWVGCRNMEQGDGTPATYTECFQFMIAPTDLAGNYPDPSRRPHVLNNSWSCPASEGCNTGGELEAIVKNVQDAGIFVVASAGNRGPTCSLMSAPGMYDESFSVGATDSNNVLASFSSRGPSLFYNPSRPKPNLSAPGVNVRSATNTSDDAYQSLSGTSMAGPHVAGVVALLWSARPSLIGNIEQTKEILQRTANPSVSLTSPETCGGIESTRIPNNSFGHGRVDALATLNVGLTGRVLTQTGNGLSNATVRLSGPGGSSRTVRTNALGFFSFSEAYVGGNYSLTVTSKRFRFSPLSFIVSDNMSSMNIVGQE